MTTPVFGDLTASIAEQLPGVVRSAMGTTVFRIRTVLIFWRCWNLVTPWLETASWVRPEGHGRDHSHSRSIPTGRQLVCPHRPFEERGRSVGGLLFLR